MRLRTIIIMLALGIASAEAQISVRDFGALGDGQHIDSPAINAAIGKVAAGGGGMVVLPKGTYLSYSVHLQSGVTLRLEERAVLKAALALRDCKGVTVRGVSFLKCGHFAMLLTGVDNLLIEDVSIDTNRDGMDIDCCERVTIRNVEVTDADSRYACLIAGVEGHPVRNVSIENLDIEFRGGLTLEDVEQQRGRNPFFIPEARKPTDHGEANYPEPSAHGIQPAWGFSISHAEDIRLENIRLRTIHKDERPWLYQEATKDIKIKRKKINNKLR